MTLLKFCIVVLLFLGTMAAAIAQPRPPGAFAPPAPPPPPPQAAVPDGGGTAQGTVARLLPTPAGEVDGLLLDSGLLVRFPPHMTAALLGVVGQGDAVTVEGMRLGDGPTGQMQAWRITNRSSGRSVAEASPPALGPRSWSGRDMRVSGTVTRALTGPRGETNGVILDNGTVVRFPPHVGEAFADLVRPGAQLAAQGYGTSGPAGTAIEAVALGASEASLTITGPRRP
jgi:hypothetical protein